MVVTAITDNVEHKSTEGNNEMHSAVHIDKTIDQLNTFDPAKQRAYNNDNKDYVLLYSIDPLLQNDLSENSIFD